MAALFEKTRFDVEQEIMELHSFATIIQNYANMLYDGEFKQTEDDVHTTLSGFANLLISHSETMMVTHCKHYELNQYATPEQKKKQYIKKWVLISFTTKLKRKEAMSETKKGSTFIKHYYSETFEDCTSLYGRNYR